MRIRLMAVIVFLLTIPAGMAAQKFPEAIRGQRVYDTARLLKPETVTAVEGMLSSFEQQTGIQIAFASTPSLGGAASIEEYAVKLFEKLRIGNADKDNGLLFVICTDPRKIRIEVGYGLEAYLTDGTAGQIVREKIVPLLKDNRWDEAVLTGTQAIIGELGPKTLPEREAEKAEAERQAAIERQETIETLKTIGWVVVGLIVLIVPPIVFMSIRNKRKEERLRYEGFFSSAQDHHAALTDKITRYQEQLEEVKDKLSTLQSSHFPADFAAAEKELQKLTTTLANINLALPRLVVSPSMPLDEVHSIYRDLSWQNSRTTYLDPHLILANLDAKQAERKAAKESSQRLLKRLPAKFAKAEKNPETIKHRGEFERAVSEFERTDNMSKTEPVEWITVLASLNCIDYLLDIVTRKPDPVRSEPAQRQASNHRDTTSTKRSSTRSSEDERRSTWASSSTTDWGSSSSSGGGGSDFGGGSSGGGGASSDF